MRLSSLSKYVCTVQVLAGTKEKVAAAPVGIKHSIKVLFIRDADGPGWQSCILIGIIWGIKFQMPEKVCVSEHNHSNMLP